jgi:Subtilase family
MDLLPVKVANASGVAQPFDVARGIRWATDQGANVIYVGLGIAEEWEVLQKAVAYARAAGVIIVAPAGDTSAQPFFPAAFEHVVAVGSLDQNNDPVGPK